MQRQRCRCIIFSRSNLGTIIAIITNGFLGFTEILDFWES